MRERDRGRCFDCAYVSDVSEGDRGRGRKRERKRERERERERAQHIPGTYLRGRSVRHLSEGGDRLAGKSLGAKTKLSHATLFALFLECRDIFFGNRLTLKISLGAKKKCHTQSFAYVSTSTAIGKEMQIG